MSALEKELETYREKLSSMLLAVELGDSHETR